MTTALIWLPTALVTALAMEAWAGMLHEHVWHGRLWTIHVSHHRRRLGRFETNDLLSGLHAPLAIALILYGCRAAPGPWREVAFGVGVGMTAFGLAYLLVHDGVVHGRLPVKALQRIGYLRRVADAHRVHHAGVRGGAPYGFFNGPRELRRRRSHLKAPPGEAPAASSAPPTFPSASR